MSHFSWSLIKLGGVGHVGCGLGVIGCTIFVFSLGMVVPSDSETIGGRVRTGGDCAFRLSRLTPLGCNASYFWFYWQCNWNKNSYIDNIIDKN